jgi:signal transduction histidine kinase
LEEMEAPPTHPLAMALDELLKRQSTGMVIAIAAVLLLLLGVLDYITGWELSVSLLYALIIFLVAWRATRKTALTFATVSGVIWCVANLRVHPYSTNLGYAWAAFTRLAYFIFVAIGGASLKAYRESNRARIEALEHARALEHEIARVSESEQRRIGQDLHDGICQSLAAIQFAVSSMRDDLKSQSPEDAEGLQEIATMVKDTISETRNLARRIFPVQMEEAGLAAVLDELVSSLRRHHRVEAIFDTHGEVKIRDPEVAMHLYRIAQEAVNNALKHGHPKKVVISLHEDESALQLAISDDGAGAPAPSSSADGMGLKTMRHRANLLGASLDIRSALGGGVSVICSLPKSGVASSPSSLNGTQV